MTKLQVLLASALLNSSKWLSEIGFSAGCYVMHGHQWREWRAHYLKIGATQNRWKATHAEHSSIR
jgi:hypothetical protein